MRRRLVAVLALAAALPLALADEGEEEGGRPQIFVDSDVVAMHLSRAQRLEKDQEWRTLFNLFQDLLAKHPDRVWEVQPGRYVGIRQEILRRLRGYPPEALRMYREMQTPDAAVLWDRFREKGDESCLQQLTDRYSFTRYGEEAARLLASRALERGDGGRALSLLVQVVGEKSGEPEELARLILRTALLAQRAGLAERLEWAAAQATPDVAGVNVSVGGREMTLAAALGAIRAASPPAAASALADWPSMGGSPANDRVGSGDAVAEVVAWSWPKSFEQVPDASQPPPNVSFAPAIVDGCLYYCDGQSVVSLDMQNGKRFWMSATGTLRKPEDFLTHLSRFNGASVEAILGCTVENGIVYANLVTPGDMNGSTKGSSSIAAYDIAKSGSTHFTPAKEGIPSDGIITCPPLVRDGRLYAPIVRPGAEPSVYLGCWSAKTGKPIWPKPTFLCGSVRYAVDRYQEQTPCPAATIAAGAGKIFVQTNLGGIAAVNESNGEVAWITDTFRLMSHAPRPRGARPSEVMSLPILLGDTLWCIPRESELVLALDAATGAPRHPPRTIEGAHTLMGVLGQRLVALAERRNQQYLLSIPLDPTRHEERSIPMAPPLAGRGFLTQGIAYVPGGADLHRFDTRTWRLTYKLPWAPKEAAGHTIVSGDTIITIGRRIHALCSKEAYRARFHDQFESGLPDVWIERGNRCRSNGQYEDAMTDLEHALTLCRLPGTTIEDPQAAEVRADLASLYLQWGRKAEADGDIALAAGAYAWSVLRQDDPRLRIEPLLAQAAIHEKQERWGNRAACLARVLVECPDGVWTPEPRFRVRTHDLVARRLAALKDRHGDLPFAGLAPEAAQAVRRAIEGEAHAGPDDAAPLPEANEPPVPSPPVQTALIQLPEGTLDDESEASALPAVTPVRVRGGLAKPLDLRNYGGHVEARRPGSDEVVWTVPDNRGWLGIVMSDANSENAVILTKILPDEPAAKAGFQTDDQVQAVDGVRVEDSDHLIQLIASRPEEKAVFTVLRSGEEVTIPMTTGCRGLKRGERVEEAVATPAGRLLLRRARRVQVVDAADGRILWGYPLPRHDDGAQGRVSNIVDVCCARGRVVVLGITGSNESWARVACLEEATGEFRWSRDLPGSSSAVFPIGSTLVGVTSSSGEVTVLDARSGSRVGEPVAAMVLAQGGVAAAAAGRFLYIVTASGTLKALDPVRAAEPWAVKLDALGEGTLCDLAVAEGVVAVVRSGRGIQAFDALTGDVLGSGKPSAEGGLASVTVWPGPLILSTCPAGDGWRLSALDLAKGPDAAWELHFPKAESLAVAHGQEDRVFVRFALAAEAVKEGTPAVFVASVDRATGERHWEHGLPECKTTPRVSAQGGKLCVSFEDKMYLFGK